MQSNLDDLPVGGGGGGEGGSYPIDAPTSFLDEQPVGGGSSINPPQLQQPASSEPDHSGTPADRQKSKNWIVRQKLYEEMTEAYKTTPDGKAECFSEQCGSWKKYIQEENNPMGMESLMTCLAAYIDGCDPKILAASQIDLIKSLIEKGLTHAKATVKQKSTECFLSLFEVTEVFDEPTNDALLEMIKHKNAKVALTSFQALITLLGAYGPKKVQLKPFMKTMEDAAGSTTPAMKVEGLNFYKECFRWLGDSPVIEGLVKNLKQQQIDQLREDFKNIKANEPKKVPRKTRSEQKKAKEQALSGIIAQAEEEKGDDPGLDLFDAVNILKTYNAEWIEKYAHKKWQDKKADLDALYDACNQPKLANGDFSGIVNLIKEQMKDNMAQVSLASIRVCGILAEKLKKDFEGHARQLVCPILYRFKEKKTNITDACHVALENFLHCVNIEQIKDDLISTGLLEKPSTTDKSLQVTPSMKKNTCVFLEKAVQQTYIDVLQRVSSDFLSALIKLSDDPDNDTRGPALQVIGIFQGRLGEAAMSNYLKNLVQQKLTKVQEAAKEVQPSKYDQPEKKESIAPPKASQPQKKATTMKPGAQKMEEDLVIPKSKNQFDDQPIGGTRKVAGDQQIGSSKSGYDIDNLGADAFGDQAGDALIVMDNKPKSKPPARFAQKKQEETNKESSVLGDDDKPIKKAVNMDDIPIPSKKQAGDTPMEDEDRPVPKGAYNLDDLPADAFGGNDAFSEQVSKPIKKPPARLANKAKPSPQVQESVEDAPIKPAKAVNLDDMPIGSSKISADVPMTEGGDPDEKPVPRGAYNLDALGDDAFGGPPPSSSGPKKPPARFAAAKKAVDEEMKDESDVVAPPKKAVPPKAVASKPKEESKGAPKTAGGPKGPQVGDENTGEGLSKEEAIAKVEETFPPEVIENFGEEKKWNEKVLGFQGINQALPQMQPEGVIIEAIVRYTKIKMKDWKESNINLIKESIALFTTISTACENLNKRAVYVMMPFLSDKLGDVKLLNSINELLLSLSETVTPKYVALQLLKYGSQAKAPNIIKETCNILSRLTDEFGFTCMPVKEMIDFAIVSVNNSNPQVRTASMALFAILYKHAGEAIKNFIKDVKESTMKLVDEEFKKVTPYAKGEYQRKRNFKGEAAFEEKASAGAGKKGAGGGGGLDDLLPRADISKQLTPKLMPLFGDNDWKKRKEAAEKVEEMLKQANMRIKPDGLTELMDKIKQRMTDANKAVCKAYMQLICLLVEALGPNAKQFAKKILPPMMQNLADKQSLVRGDAITAMDKWAKECGAELIITLGGPMVAQDNPELRTEMLGWINRNTESIKLVVPEALKECCKPLVECLSDKTPAIRAAAETLITSVMPLTGYAAFQQVLTNLKPAVQQSIKPILEKVKAKVGDIVPAPPVQQIAQSIDGNLKTILPQPTAPQGPTLKPQVAAQAQSKPQIKAKEQPQPQSINETKMDQSLNSSISQKQLGVQTPHGQKQSQLKPSTAAQQQTGPRLKAPFAQTVSNFKPEEESEIITINFGQKDKRAEWDRKSKFHIEDFKQDQVEKLKNQAHFAFGQVFTQKLFSQDFKLHCECIDQFTRLMLNQPDSLKEVLDLVFKWTAVRLADSGNTQFGVKIFDFFAQLFNHLQQQQYLLLDFEVAVLVPLLCEKSGLNNQLLKDKAKKLLRMAFDVCDKQICYNFIVGQGLQSKNLNAIAECLDELAEFIIRNGIDYSSDKEMKLIARLADSPSKNVRESAVKALGEAFKLLDDNIWRVIGDVTPKVQGLLEARFKKIKGGPALNTLYASASMASFQTARPQTALNDGMASSLGFKPNQNQLSKPAQSSGLKGPTQAATARNIVAQQKPPQKLGSSINQIQPEQEQVQQQMSQMSLDQPSYQTESQQPKTIPSNLASKLKPLPQVQRQSNPPAPVVHQQQQQIPHQTLLQAPEDDDEDLRIFTSDMSLFDPQQERLLDDLRSHFHLMKYADISKKVDSLVTINEIVCNLNEQTISVMQKAANELISAFVHLINEVFEVPLEKMNVKFVKYFMTIVVKICSSRDLMNHVCYEMVFALAQQLLTRLMIEGLEKVGENLEGDQIQKNLNSSMLRVLENCNHTYLICSLFDLQTLHNGQDQLPKLPNLIVKCILKTTKIVEKIADKLDVGQILLSIHKYLIVVNHENKTPNQDIAIKTAKTLLNELIKIKRDDIWKDYAALRQHHIPDQHIFKWIQVILKSFNPLAANSTAFIPPSAVQVQQPQPQEQGEIIQILNELMIPSRFDATIPRLYEFQMANQDVILDNYLASYPLKSANLIKAKLNEYAMRLSMINQGHHNQQDPQNFNDYQRQTEALPRLREVQEFQNESFVQPNTANSQLNTAFGGQGSYQPMRQSLPVLQSAAQNQHQLVSPHSSQSGTPQNNLERLQQMKARMHQMKNRGAPEGGVNSAGETPVRKTETHGTNAGGLNTSFSAMNNSIGQKWQARQNQIQNTRAGLDGTPQMGQPQQPNLVSGQMDPSHQQTGINNGLNQSDGNQYLAQSQLQPQSIGGARPQPTDLSNRLAEMKAKLAALKNQKQ